MSTTAQLGGGDVGFIQHVFRFDDAAKADMSNIVQYSSLAIIPVVILNKLMNLYVAEADDLKGSAELTIEVLLQLILIFVGMLFMHRLITYVPTYSGVPYPEFNVVSVVLVFLVIILSLQTKLGEKVSILVDRIVHLWYPEPAKKKKPAAAAQDDSTSIMALPIPPQSMQEAASSTAINQALEDPSPKPFPSSIKW